MNKIKKILPGSIAEEMEIESGDILLSINNKKVVDIIDLMYLTNDEFIVVEIQKKEGEIWELEIDKEFDEVLGIEFENPIIDDATRCSNNCVFCFIDQLPPNMRSTLYFKDDDSRLSFLQGNFVTLTNLNEDKFKRIIEYRISPINVSVHTTNPELRVKMLGNRFAGNIMERLEKLTSNGIVVNAQIVLCPGYNDGDELSRTLGELITLGGNLQSVAIVPIGLTKHRKGLIEMQGFDDVTSKQVIDIVHPFQEIALKKIGTRFAFLADEFYLLSGVPFPPYEAYEAFIQHEDGVGMIRKLDHEVRAVLASNRYNMGISRRVLILTGVAAYPCLVSLAESVMAVFPKVKIDVVKIENAFFGERITVAGLVTGTDIKKQVLSAEHCDAILLPVSMFRAEEDVMLDDCSITDLETHYHKPVVKVGELGIDFVESILYGGK
ncbi:DUF512 domain-containing protein [Fusibacter sp. 3D3]|uniref:DUF512 domain-containing protein n=1 Tax=Fusibacter sp. 3D3 TaxID=1048380 RepID=UPI0008530DFC|nr:DUF512 domain-containing protein [Fusibacter sp. 3D3]GAU78702.1 Fe-S oxidoreductase related to NifB/MoaA family with PDZ N-terminal domain [Fusibacter sp. 3D3]